MKFSDVTPNLIVANVERSLAFYRDVLGFSLVTTVPGAAPFAFAWLRRDGVSVFLNSVEAVREDNPELASRPIGGTATLYIGLDADSATSGVDAMFDRGWSDGLPVVRRARVTSFPLRKC